MICFCYALCLCHLYNDAVVSMFRLTPILNVSNKLHYTYIIYGGVNRSHSVQQFSYCFFCLEFIMGYNGCDGICVRMHMHNIISESREFEHFNILLLLANLLMFLELCNV